MLSPTSRTVLALALPLFVGCRSGSQGDAPASTTTAEAPLSASSSTANAVVAPSVTPTASAAVATIPKDYDGPLGLKWGQSPPEVKKALQGKLTFVDESLGDQGKTFTQHYKGAFGGMKPENIEVDFHEKKLIAFVVQLQAKDVRPASRRWLDLVDKTAESHGKPGQLSPVPNVPKLSAALSAYPRRPTPKRSARSEASSTR